MVCRWINEAYRRPRLAAQTDVSTTSKPGRPLCSYSRILPAICLLHRPPDENPDEVPAVLGAPVGVARGGGSLGRGAGRVVACGPGGLPCRGPHRGRAPV